jgi:hypothetical protein
MNNPKTILKNLRLDYLELDELKDRLYWLDHQVQAELEDFAEQMWHNSYIEVDYSKVTPSMYRKMVSTLYFELLSLYGKPAELDII